MVVKGYRGLLTDGVQDKIRLTTTDGRMGYRVVKFQGVPIAPGTGSSNSILKIYKTEQSTPMTSTIDFTDGDLLGVMWIRDNVDANYAGLAEVIIFDNVIFNQDIFITHVETVGAEECNYYIELEQIKLTVVQAEQLIVKSLRGEVWTRP